MISTKLPGVGCFPSWTLMDMGSVAPCKTWAFILSGMGSHWRVRAEVHKEPWKPGWGISVSIVFLEMKISVRSHTKFVKEQTPCACCSALHSVFNKWHWGSIKSKDKERYLHIVKQFCPRLQLFEDLWRSREEMTLCQGSHFPVYPPGVPAEKEKERWPLGSLCHT